MKVLPLVFRALAPKTMHGRQWERFFRCSAPAASLLLRQPVKSNVATRHVSGIFVTSRPFSSGVISPEGIIRSPDPDREIPQDKPFHQYVFEHCNEHGDKKAMEEFLTGRSLTYNDIKTRSQKIASSLSNMGYKKGDVLLAVSTNNLEFPTVLLACSLLGVHFSPVNPGLTPDELAHALKVSEPKVIFTTPELAGLVEEALKLTEKAGVKEIIVTETHKDYIAIQSLLEGEATSLPNVEFNTKEDVFALPFSSGTSGFPKCVEVTHLGAFSNYIERRSLIQEKPGDRTIGLLPFYHIYGLVLVQFTPLEVGGCMYILPKFEPEIFLQCVQDKKLTLLHLVPPLIQFLAMHPIVEKFDLSSVRAIVSAAAPLSPELVSLAHKRFPHVTIVQGYGLTETLANAVTRTHASTSVGHMLPNNCGKFIDLETQKIVKPGESGEFCVKGPTVMKGYYKNPEATKKTIDSEGWLHTGDIGYYEEDGSIYITDRIKDLIKYKAFQVAPAELENLLITHPGVADVAVLGIPDSRAGEVPKAYVVKAPGANDVSEQDLVDFVKEHASSAKHLRGGVEFMDILPRSPSGKLLKRVLKAKEQN